MLSQTAVTEMLKYQCPCCGYLIFDKRPGSYDICPICFWEDDLSQLRFAFTEGGANRVSLLEGQKNYQQQGVCELHLKQHVRLPLADERQEDGWRMLDLQRDNIEIPVLGLDYGATYPRDGTLLYYWRDTFWGAPYLR